MSFLNPKNVLDKIKIEEDIVVADFGCGSGGWVIPIAKKIDEGIVFAIDLMDNPLSVLKSNIEREKLRNITVLKADVEKGVKAIRDNYVDLVLMTNLLFQCEDKKGVLKEGSRVLRKGGLVLVVDWEKDSPIGPREKVSEESIKKMAEENGFKLIDEFKEGKYHYVLVFKKS